MGELEAGLYESLVTEGLQVRLAELDDDLARRRTLDPAETPDRIALHLSRQIEQALSEVADADRARVGIEVARALIERLSALAPVDADHVPPSGEGELLRAVLRRGVDGQPQSVAEPLIPLLDTTLLTNAPGEPGLWNQLDAEIDSADRIDVIMAFIRKSGIRPLLPALARHCAAGRRLRVLTTTYTGSTERAALDQLVALGAEVQISYDLSTTRLHAKAWVFHRRSGFSTAYVGSSNLTHSAQVTGLEWNVRASAARNAAVLDKFAAVFDSYWQGHEFVPFEPSQFDDEAARAGRTDHGPLVLLSPTEVRLEPFQERLLELIEVARCKGHHRNLLVAATGTGKTVMAALDFAALRERLPSARLLFVAHREELLDQAMATFRHALRDPSFGEKWVGGSRPTRFEQVFASIQSLRAAGYDHLPPDHFDIVIVDEFHHAAATSYEALLSHVQPVELLGLTATPERSDGLSILHWFDDRIAAELRLWDAIDQHRLVPFAYYGIHDGLDLQQVPWRRGRGYDVEALTDAYTSTDSWARLVIKQLLDHVDDPDRMRCLAFCVSVDHARYMARVLTENGISAVAVWGDSPEAERRGALQDLAAGRIRVVCSVDLFNEGVDVPAVDTVLMLRPTESPTLFLQQLGRGLRLARGKTFCTVLDFVGTHRKEFRFDRRFQALLGGTRRDVQRAVEARFPFLPAGCHLELDRKSSEIVLRSLKDAIPSNWRAKVEELRRLDRLRPGATMAGFLDETGLELADLYDGQRGWSDLCEAAGLTTLASGAHETELRRAVGRQLHIDDAERTEGIRQLFAASQPPQVDALGLRERRLLHMLVAGVGNRVLHKDTDLQAAVDLVWSHRQVGSELFELSVQLEQGITHLHPVIEDRPELPLHVHARYTRLEILAAFGMSKAAKVASWQSGVFDAKAADADLFAFTLDKSSSGFSPTTRYRDYAVTPSLIHWESQAVTRADSPTGQRYQHHERLGRSVFLFARHHTSDRAFWFLGPATYCSHEGEKPMAITWRLDHPLPGDLYASFAAAVA